MRSKAILPRPEYKELSFPVPIFYLGQDSGSQKSNKIHSSREHLNEARHPLNQDYVARRMQFKARLRNMVRLCLQMKGKPGKMVQVFKRSGGGGRGRKNLCKIKPSLI